MASEVARVLLQLVEARLVGIESGAALSPTVGLLASHVGLIEHDARAVIHAIQPAGVIVHRRHPLDDHYPEARWARGVELAPQADIRGPGRPPRLVKLALLLEPDVVVGDLLDTLLRRAGIVAVQAMTGAEATRLLEHIGCELVFVDSAAAVQCPGAEALAAAIRAAGCDHAVPMRRSDALAWLDHHVVGDRVTLAKPFSVRTFDALLVDVMFNDLGGA